MANQSMYEELMNKHNIVSIMGGSDFAVDLVTGGIKMSKRGSIMWKGKAHNSMFQFVRSYEMNLPKLKAQFNEILNSQVKEAALVEASNRHSEEMTKKMTANEPIDGVGMHALSDAHRASKVACEVCAASIFITLNTLLQALKDELEVDQQKFIKSGPLYSGQSFGNVVWAASNNARHADEWRVEWVANKAFNKQQLKSVQVLAPVLGHEERDYRFLAGKVCTKILEVLGCGNFDILEQGLFIFANNLAAGVENNKD